MLAGMAVFELLERRRQTAVHGSVRDPAGRAA